MEFFSLAVAPEMDPLLGEGVVGMGGGGGGGGLWVRVCLVEDHFHDSYHQSIQN